MQRIAFIGALTGVLLLPLAAVADNTDDDIGDYIKVEIRGTLESGIMAIGGETTGVMITVRDVAWELDVGGDAALRELVSRLHGKAVVVRGAYRRIPGIEIPYRDIVTVTTLEAVEEE